MWKLLVILLLTPVVEACPLGKGEEHLTIQRVMRNFGRFTLSADANALKGMNPHDKVSSAAIAKTIDDLEIAISCAQAAVLPPLAGALLPACTEALSETVRIDYINLYVKLMKDFESELVVYQNLYKLVLMQPEETRDFNGIYKQSKKIEELVDSAHKQLFRN